MRPLPFCLLFLAVFARTSAEQGRLPFPVAVEVAQSNRAVSETVLDDVRRELARELDLRGCFERVANLDRLAAGLVARVVVTDALEETRYDLGIADRSRSQDPRTDRAYVSKFEVSFVAELRTLPERLPIRVKRFRIRSERRPLAAGENATEEARADAVVRIARQARAFVCGISRTKLERRMGERRAR